MYCGNNRLSPQIVIDGDRIGTRYECLKKGIGIGKNLPFDPAYAVGYKPIDKTKIYCGKKKRKPAGYDRMGSPPACLQIGVGIGKRIRAKQKRRAIPRISPKNKKKKQK